MSLDGPAFYDSSDIFQTYQSHRNRPENPNNTLEKPTFLELVGNVSHRRILDLGCGDASFGRQALDRECSSYVGVEGSRNMVALAQQTLAGTMGHRLSMQTLKRGLFQRTPLTLSSRGSFYSISLR